MVDYTPYKEIMRRLIEVEKNTIRYVRASVEEKERAKEFLYSKRCREICDWIDLAYQPTKWIREGMEEYNYRIKHREELYNRGEKRGRKKGCNIPKWHGTSL